MARRGLAPQPGGPPPVLRDLAGPARIRRPGGAGLAPARRRHLGGQGRGRQPRALQAVVQALAAAGRHAEATDRFSELLSLSSPLGLYGEEMDPTSRHHLGNYPQALTNAALVQAALALRSTA